MESDPSESPIRIPIWLWRRLILQLRRRGKGLGESGAFLLGPQHGTSGRVTAFLCYDDLDPNAYHGGAIAFHAIGHAALWEQCRNGSLRVLADVHTHPGQYVGQSSTDQRNPMIPLRGHTAMIVPNFGNTPWWSLDAVGIYEYLGDFKWHNQKKMSHGSRRVTLTLW